MVWYGVAVWFDLIWIYRTSAVENVCLFNICWFLIHYFKPHGRKHLVQAPKQQIGSNHYYYNIKTVTKKNSQKNMSSQQYNPCWRWNTHLTLAMLLLTTWLMWDPYFKIMSSCSCRKQARSKIPFDLRLVALFISLSPKTTIILIIKVPFFVTQKSNNNPHSTITQWTPFSDNAEK